MIAEVGAQVGVVGRQPVRRVGVALGAVERRCHGSQAARIVEVVTEGDQTVRLPRPGARVVGLLQRDDVVDLQLGRVPPGDTVVGRAPVTGDDVAAGWVELGGSEQVADEHFGAGVAPVAVEVACVAETVAVVAALLFVGDGDHGEDGEGEVGARCGRRGSDGGARGAGRRRRRARRGRGGGCGRGGGLAHRWRWPFGGRGRQALSSRRRCYRSRSSVGSLSSSPTAAPMPASARKVAPPYAVQRCQRGRCRNRALRAARCGPWSRVLGFGGGRSLMTSWLRSGRSEVVLSIRHHEATVLTTSRHGSPMCRTAVTAIRGGERDD